MRKKTIYKTNDIIGNCQFIEELPTVKIGKHQSVKRVALFRCNCGNTFKAILLQVKNGNTKSCGCLIRKKIAEVGKRNATHGQRKHPLYKTWQGMLRRCNSPKDESYHNYGGRGILVCNSWKDINNFINDMYPSYIKGLDIDRINVNGNYSKENCRWVTRKQNMNNTRRNRMITYKGDTHTLSEWSDKLNIPYKTLIYRVNNWNIEKAFNEKFKKC